MDPYTGKAPPTAPPPYGWETQQSNVAINQPSAPYPTLYPPHQNVPGPQQPLLGPPQQPQGPRQPLLHGQAQYEYYQGYQACPQYPPPQSGYQPAPSYPNNPSHGQPKPSVVIVGGCPACRVGVLEDDFTCFGVCCAIFCFPIGILCCLAMRQRRCSNCGANFS